MNLNLLTAGVSALETWVKTSFGGAAASPKAQTAAVAAAPSISAATSGVAAAETALETAIDALADGMAEEAIAKLPGGELVDQFAGPLLTSFINKLVDKGAHAIPGWQAPSLVAPAPAPSAAPAAPQPAV